MGFFTDIAAPYISDSFGSLVDIGVKSWDYFADSPALIAGAVGVAGGIADYYGEQEKTKAYTEANTYASRANQEQLARHNKGIEDLANMYRERKKGVLQGGTT